MEDNNCIKTPVIIDEAEGGGQEQRGEWAGAGGAAAGRGAEPGGHTHPRRGGALPNPRGGSGQDPQPAPLPGHQAG